MLSRAAAFLLFFPAALSAQEAKPGSAPKPDAQPAKAEFIGSEACALCHEDLAKAFAKTRHQGLEKELKRGWQGKSCEACHGPGSIHAETADVAAIINPAKRKTIDENAGCLACHVNQTSRVGKIVSGHAKDQVSCSQCHKVHPKEGELLFERRKPQINAMCSNCHQNVWASFQRPHAHRLPEGAMSCVDCHNPHNPTGYAAQRISFGNEPSCFSCHTNLRGPFAFEHDPIRTEGCTACHVQHGSPNPKMLTRNEVRTVCLECHSNIGMTGPGAVPPAFHDLRSTRFQNCTTCHRKIHGSHVDRSLQR